MSKTKAELQEENNGLSAQLENAETALEEAETALENAGVEEIPEHGHSRHESRAERQNRLQSRHLSAHLRSLQPAD